MLSQQIVEGGERIARLIPKRNIETWVLCLNDQAVDEETDYKDSNYPWNDLIPRAAEELYGWTRPNAELPDHCVDSLRSGVSELKGLAF